MKKMADEEHPPTHAPKSKATNSFVIPVPQFTFKQTGANGFLVLSLVIFSFLLGMLTNKVIYLQEALNAPVPTPAPSGQQAAEPTPPPVVKNLGVGKLPLQGNKNAKVTL